MILFLNVYITNSSQGLKYDRGLLGQVTDRLAVFKYSLASFAVIPWSKVVIYYDLADNCKAGRADLESFIHTLFKEPEIHRFQNERQDQWQTAVRRLDEVDDELVMFCCNDDHIFIDYENDLWLRVEAACREKLRTARYLSFVPTHWPEYVANQRVAVEETPDYLSCLGQVTNSMQVVSKALLRYWWFEHDYGGAWMPRSDAGTLVHSHDGSAPPRLSVVAPEPYPVIVPFRELIRHFDGYSHAAVDIDTCPPLTIPEGFFEKKIRIAYGAELPSPGWVLVNPLKSHHRVVDRCGADLKCVLEDLPLFWRSRIAEMEVAEALPESTLLRRRNEAVVEMATWCQNLPVDRLRAALRFAEAADVGSEMESLQKFIRQRRFDQHYDRLAQQQTPRGMAEAQEFQRWQSDRKQGARVNPVVFAPGTADQAKEALQAADWPRLLSYLEATGQLGFAKGFDPESAATVRYSFVDQFERGQLILGNKDQASIWSVTVDGQKARTIFLHPPARLAFQISDPRSGLLSFAITLHPDVRTKPGVGHPVFKLTVDNREQLAVRTDAAWIQSGAGWWEFNLVVPALESGSHTIVFETCTADANRNHCWALWREPVFWLMGQRLSKSSANSRSGETLSGG